MTQRPHVVWVHPQPEPYLNRMLDALARVSELEYSVIFLQPSRAKLERPLPEVTSSTFLRIRPGREQFVFHPFKPAHVDWKADVFTRPIDALICAGYASPTQRDIMKETARRGIPLGMFSDSNLRGEKGNALRQRIKRTLKKRWLRPLIQRVDCMLTANRLGVAYWRYYGTPKDKIVRCPYYADYEQIARVMPTDRAETLHGFGLDAERKLMVTAARLVPVKGLAPMITAWRAARLGEKGWTYAIAGTGPLEAELKALAGPEAGKSIRFLGFVQQSGLLGLIRHADLFCLPSIFEPHGIVIQEALAAGTPVLASHVCGAAFDLVQNGHNGWIFRSGNDADLLAKLQAATADAPRLAAMRPVARQVFEEWFEETDPVKVVDRWAHQVVSRTRERSKS